LPRTDNMFDFIKTELTEARLFNYPDNLKGRNALDLAKLLFCSVLCLEIMRHEHEHKATDYVLKTMAFADFDHMRAANTDLGNMISVLSNQDKYEDELKTKVGLYAPVLQLRTYLRSFNSGYNPANIRAFLIRLDDDLMIAGPDLHQARRTVSNWAHASSDEKMYAWSAISRAFQNNGNRLDIYVLAKNYFSF